MFKIIKELLSYFITNNSHINNTYLDYLVVKFSINKAIDALITLTIS